jgi:hypothetical protein
MITYGIRERIIWRVELSSRNVLPIADNRVTSSRFGLCSCQKQPSGAPEGAPVFLQRLEFACRSNVIALAKWRKATRRKAEHDVRRPVLLHCSAEMFRSLGRSDR